MPDSDDRLTAVDDVRAIADLGRSPTRSAMTEDAVRARLHIEMTRAHDRGHAASRSVWATRSVTVAGRGRVAVAAGVAIGASIAGVSLLTTSGTPGRSFPEAVAELAQQAQAPNAIVHFTVSGDDVEGQPGARRETWATVDGSTIRYRTTQPDGDYTDVLLERQDDSSRLTTYISTTNTIFHTPWTRRALGPSSLNQLSITDVGRYADAIREGNAKLAGDTTIGGTPAYRITQARPGGTQVWFVSKDAQHPRLLRIQRACPASSEPCPTTDFSSYTVTDDTGSLRFPDHPGAATKTVDPGADDGPPPPTN